MRSLWRSHLSRVWRKHWALQMASVTVMTVVLIILNLMFLGLDAFNGVVSQWGRGMEMTVYLKENAADVLVENLKASLVQSGDFEQVTYTSKTEATKKFLAALGPESLDLLSDPKWHSPIPAGLDLRLAESIPMSGRVAALQEWSKKLLGTEPVEDVFYGQGWIESFSGFLRSTRILIVFLWGLSLSVGLLIVSNCIRLSFLQRREEIEILELVGATSRFIRTPFLIEGIVLGLLASVFSLALSFGLHALLLAWLGDKWSFWVAVNQVPALKFSHIAINLLTGIGFGLLGAWNCVRKLNTGWLAVG